MIKLPIYTKVYKKTNPKCSMYGIFTYIYHRVMINVGKIFPTWSIWELYQGLIIGSLIPLLMLPMDIPVDFVFFQKSPRHFASANKVFSHSGLSVETTETKNGWKFVWDSKVVLLFDVFFLFFGGGFDLS